jgi:uncharacterized protein YkwD
MKRHAATAACVALIWLSFNAAAEDSESGSSTASNGGAQPPTKATIRHPGSTTARQGGVGPRSSAALPVGAAAVRSPGATSAAQPGATPRDAASRTELDALQAPVLDRVNYHRALAGLPPVAADARLLKAAQSHSSYLDSTNQMGHYEDKKTNPYYTGNSPFDRIDAVHYDYAEAGEVVARQPSSHPAAAVDALMTAIYHRFIILSVDFVHAGPGVVLKNHQGVDELNVTVDFGAETLPPSPPPSLLTVYPADTQTGIPTDFDPAEEFPNPMPGHKLVGYPVSIQVDARQAFTVQSLELYEMAPNASPRALDAKLLTHARDAETPAHAAALIPVSPLAPLTIHQVMFSGSVNGIPVSRTWQFLTAPEQTVTMNFASPTIAPGGVQQVALEGLDSEKGPYYLCYAPARLVKGLVYESETQIAMTTSTDCEPNSSCQVSVSASYRSCTKPFAGGTFTITQ